jgi:hypothetical protein
MLNHLLLFYGLIHGLAIVHLRRKLIVLNLERYKGMPSHRTQGLDSIIPIFSVQQQFLPI